MVVVRIISSMDARVAVFQHVVVVGMGVAFSQMQCDAEQHQQARYHALSGQRLTQQNNRQRCTGKRRYGKVSTCARRAQVAQADHKQAQADPLAGKAQRRRYQNDRQCG